MNLKDCAELIKYSGLTEEEREVLELYFGLYENEKTFEEIAKVMPLKISTIRRRYLSGLEKVKQGFNSII